jgi:hypothetical protein
MSTVRARLTREQVRLRAIYEAALQRQREKMRPVKWRYYWRVALAVVATVLTPLSWALVLPGILKRQEAGKRRARIEALLLLIPLLIPFVSTIMSLRAARKSAREEVSQIFGPGRRPEVVKFTVNNTPEWVRNEHKRNKETFKSMLYHADWRKVNKDLYTAGALPAKTGIKDIISDREYEPNASFEPGALPGGVSEGSDVYELKLSPPAQYQKLPKLIIEGEHPYQTIIYGDYETIKRWKLIEAQTEHYVTALNEQGNSEGPPNIWVHGVRPGVNAGSNSHYRTPNDDMLPEQQKVIGDFFRWSKWKSLRDGAELVRKYEHELRPR